MVTRPRKPAPPGLSESDIKRNVVDALKLMLAGRGKILRLNAGTIRLGGRVLKGVEPGTPDLLVMLPAGRCVWLELKTQDGKVEPLQTEWHAHARALGHHVAVCRTVQDAVATVLHAMEAA